MCDFDPTEEPLLGEGCTLTGGTTARREILDTYAGTVAGDTVLDFADGSIPTLRGILDASKLVTVIRFDVSSERGLVAGPALISSAVDRCRPARDGMGHADIQTTRRAPARRG